MGKPFKISTPAPTRDDRGRFVQLTPPSPPQIVDKARQSGTPVDEVVAEERVPDHPISNPTKKADGTYETEIQWPKAGPVNDANKKPMRVG
jgi:hypothetical protein